METDGNTPAPTATAAAGDDPLAALRPLDLAGTIKIGQLKILNLNTANIALNIKSTAGVLSLDSIKAELYEGKLAGNIRIDVRKKEPRIEINNTLSGVQINPLMRDFSGNEKLAGKGSVNVALRMNGLEASRIKQTLNGSISVVLADGVYKGVDVIKTICSAGRKIETLLGGGTGELDQSGDTEFSAMSAKILFVDGIASNDDLDIKSPLLRVTGRGGANLPQDTLDYLIDAELVKACEGQGGSAADKLVGVPLPIRAKGPMTNPKISPDWAALGKKLAGSKIQDSASALLNDKLKIPGLGDSGDATSGESRPTI